MTTWIARARRSRRARDDGRRPAGAVDDAPAAPTGRNIIIVGQQKTGTTGVYSLVKSALAPLAQEYFFSFEPRRGRPLEQVVRRDPTRSVLTKIMYKHVANFDLDMFPRRVMTVRDPRDTIVSTLLFKPLVKKVVTEVGTEQHERFIDGLRAKEADPRSVGIGALMALADDVGYRHHRPEGFAGEIVQMAEFAQDEGFHVVRYEDFVDHEVADLASYLGLPLDPGAAQTSGWLTHITRSKAHGAWRDWFTPEDVDLYRPLLAEPMRLMGYEDDWELSPEPRIAPATSSEYVADRIAKRRQELSSADRSEDGVDAGVSIATLHSMAADGNARAALELARRLDGTTDFGGRWPKGALRWAREAELQGLAGAGALRERLERELSGPTRG